MKSKLNPAVLDNIHPDILAAIYKTLGHEGGFVNDSRDPGGATNRGVTLQTMIDNDIDVNGDGVVDINDVRILPLQTAVLLYAERYIFDWNFHLIPLCLQDSVFDHGVLSGQHNAGKLLQRVINKCGRGMLVSEDGRVGPRTINACKKMVAELGEDTARIVYALARRDWYFKLVRVYRPDLRCYVIRDSDGGKAGWITRAEKYLPPSAASLKLTDAAFRAKVAKW